MNTTHRQPAMDPTEAQRLDNQIVDIRRHRRMRSVVICEALYKMGEQGYQALGYPTFDAYLEARRIPRAWAYFMRSIHRKLAVELKVPAREWLDIPPSRLRGIVKMITQHNVKPLLADARALTRCEFKARLRMLRSEGYTWLEGTYRLEPVDRPEHIVAASRRSQRPLVYRTRDGNWYANFMKMEDPVRVGGLGRSGTHANAGRSRLQRLLAEAGL